MALEDDWGTFFWLSSFFSQSKGIFSSLEPSGALPDSGQVTTTSVSGL